MARRKIFDKSAWMLTRERFQLTDAEPPADAPFVSIRDVLAGIFKKIEANRQPWLDQLEREWVSLVGDLTSGHARPAGLRGRTLEVYADSSAWLNELVRYRRAEMLARLQEKFGPERIKAISFKLDPGGSRGSAHQNTAQRRYSW